MLEFRRVLFRSEEHTSELQSHSHLVCRLLLEKKHGSRARCRTAWPSAAARGGRSAPPPAPLRTPSHAAACAAPLPVRRPDPCFFFFLDHGGPPDTPPFPCPAPLRT